MATEKLHLTGWEYHPTGPQSPWNEKKELQFDYDNFKDPAPGRVISLKAATKMVHTHWKEQLDEIDSPEKEQEINKRTAAITFSKRTLLLLLSQENCEGIRFYICKSPKPGNHLNLKTSLVLVGIGKNNQDLGVDGNDKSIFRPYRSADDSSNPTILIEVGGHDTLKEMRQNLKIDFDSLFK
ncbi:hypothetical protein JMN32_14915 [Fulvivirga sp. 29W222]|uniref:Uncharacterized protein n=1 Tax=Fulvivirga marina TaxID=2494733 RepID=A0A937FZ00_9BACT|nr:hypothetical protein [Fulvivirga marina]MBL6447607.1 hypothetical protein [Fulvivirga marina]